MTIDTAVPRPWPKPVQIKDRFWKHVDKNGPNGCWLWTGTRSRDDYGVIAQSMPVHTPRRAHRIAYELLVGPIPEGLTIDHLCRNRGCVNPAHMEPVTSATNVLRGDGLTAQNARKTACVHGHRFTPDNTMMRGHKRRCRTCHLASKRATYRRGVARATEAVSPEERIQRLRSDHPITPVPENHPDFGPIHRCSLDGVRVHWITRSWRHDLAECTALFAQVYGGAWPRQVVIEDHDAFVVTADME